MDFKNLPKVELHLHLDCSLSYDAARKIDTAISPDYYRQNFISPPKCSSLSQYIKGAAEGIRLMQNKTNLRIVVDDLFRQLKEDNVIYAEIRFAPLLHLENGLNAEEVVKAVEGALSNAVNEYGIEARLILSTLRHFNKEQSLETVRLTGKFMDSRVAGLDLAGDEAGFPVDQHTPAFKYARDNSIQCTAHAGEARGPESVYEVIENLNTARIGHGIRCIEDQELMRRIKERNIHLEVCPTSNVQSGVYNEYKDHPVKKLFDYGVSVGINTDARTLSNITLSEEYRKLSETFGWTEREFYICNMNALNAAFVPESVKAGLISKLEAGMKNF